jgi:type IX secretion system PorP/SprF family membrane protein
MKKTLHPYHCLGLILILSSTLTFTASLAKAQDYIPVNAMSSIKTPHFIMFWNSKSLFNPAASGIDDKYYLGLTVNEYWMGMKNAPVNIGAFFEAKSEALHGALGINYVNTKTSQFFSNHAFNANYSYHRKLGNNRILSAGIAGGLALYKSDNSTTDPLTNDNGVNTFYNFHLGLFYQSNHLGLGVSSNHYEYVNMDLKNAILSQISIFSSYRFDLGEILDISPEVLMTCPLDNKYDINISAGLLFTIKDIFRTGFVYGIDDIYGVTAGVDIAGKVRLSYAVEMRKSMQGGVNYGNHELLVALKIR